MKVNADLYVKDVPGQLVSSLEPISLVDGNIVGVVHNREQIVNGRIVVNVTFNVDTIERLDTLKKIWKSRDVIISNMDSVVETITVEYMLIGDITASYVEALMNEASNAISFDSMDASYSSKAGNDERTAMLSVKVHTQEDVKNLDRFFVAACREGGIVCVRGI